MQLGFSAFLAVYMLLLSLSAIGDTAVPIYQVDASFETRSDFPVLLINDQQSTLSIDDFPSALTQGELAGSRVNIASNKQTFWFVFDLHSIHPTPFNAIVSFDEIFMDSTVIHFQTNDGMHKEASGLNVPISDRKVRSKTPTFIVPLLPNETKRIYVSLHSKLHNYIGLQIATSQGYHQVETFRVALDWAYMGAVIALLIYNLFLYLSLRKMTYFIYVAYGTCFLWFVAMYSGYTQYIFSGEQAYYYQHISIVLVFVLTAQFSRSILRTRNQLPMADKLLNGMTILFLAFIPLFIINIESYRAFLAVGAVSALIFIIIGLVAANSGVKIAKFYLAATTLYMGGVFVSATAALGLLPFNLVTRYAYQFGALFELLVFSFALAYLIKQEQTKKLRAQNLLVDAEKRLRADMEVLVKQRTEELEIANEKLLHISLTDSLTGVPNRRHFDERLRSEWRRHSRNHKSLALVMCDIDYFKQFNDTLGHQAGDHCLQEVAKLIRQALDRPFDIVARYGGEEFVVVLPETDILGAEHMAKSIKNLLESAQIHHPYAPAKGFVSLSYGVTAMIPKEHQSPDILIQQADEALYLSKENGRNSISRVS